MTTAYRLTMKDVQLLIMFVTLQETPHVSLIYLYLSSTWQEKKET